MIKLTNEITVLGDQHLGKKFLNGTPLHRRGDRRQMQMDDFKNSLLNCETPLHVNVGDLFDEVVVPYNDVFAAARTYRHAAEQNPDIHYYVTRGNHDATKDATRVSAYMLFAAMLEDVPNITVSMAVPIRFGDYCIIPWHPEHDAETMVELHADLIRDAEIVFGHWDIVAISNTSNLIPAQSLADLGVKRIVTGHDHGRRDLTIAGLPVFVTGSMQPYSHAEDPDDNLYVTLSPEEAMAQADDLVDKCVRIELQPGQVFDQVIDCLQLSVVRRTNEADEEDMEVGFEEFDFEALLRKACAEAELDDEQFIAELLGKIEDGRAHES
jgi:DNA repair exonuclease SbcCD nuclease subunit